MDGVIPVQLGLEVKDYSGRKIVTGAGNPNWDGSTCILQVSMPPGLAREDLVAATTRIAQAFNAVRVTVVGEQISSLALRIEYVDALAQPFSFPLGGTWDGASVLMGISDGGAEWRVCLSGPTRSWRAPRGLMYGSPLRELRDDGTFDAMHLLELAPPDAIRQLGELVEIANAELIPHIGGPYVLGPTFDGSGLCAADADVIASGFLLDFKTSLGSKVSRPGGRSDCLKLKDLHQLVAYALFDYSDSHRIHRAGFYSARFGHLVSWELAELLETLAGRPVDIADAREQVWRVLGGRPPTQ